MPFPRANCMPFIVRRLELRASLIEKTCTRIPTSFNVQYERLKQSPPPGSATFVLFLFPYTLVLSDVFSQRSPVWWVGFSLLMEVAQSIKMSSLFWSFCFSMSSLKRLLVTGRSQWIDNCLGIIKEKCNERHGTTLPMVLPFSFFFPWITGFPQ